jgi:hypothetical protein
LSVIFLIKFITLINSQEERETLLRPIPCLAAVSLFSFYGFILYKAFSGYAAYGALAFRNAALFYYSFFAVFSYNFFDIEAVSKKWVKIVLLLTLLALVLFRRVYGVFLYTYVLLIIILLLNVDKRYLRYVLICILAVFFPYEYAFGTSRSVILSNLSALLFLCLIFFRFIKIRLRYKASAVIVLFAAAFLLILLYADKSNLKTLLTPHLAFKNFLSYADYIDSQKAGFKAWDNLKVRLYADNRGINIRDAEIIETKTDNGIYQMDSKPVIITEQETGVDKNRLSQAPPYVKQQQVKNARPINAAYSSISWRFLVWRDMINDLLENGGLFGIPFGKPFRPISIQILNCNQSELRGVGWSEPHNSYIHIIYRAGIMGAIYILVMLACFFYMLNIFFNRRNIKGILLCSVLVYWMVLTNFVVVLELPYYAIPYWCLFGAILKYAVSVKRKIIIGEQNG